MSKTTKKKYSSAAAKLGSLGGKSVAKKRGKKYMREIGRRGASARWGGKDIKK